VLHNDGPEMEIAYRPAWARTYLKGIGLLTNSAPGVWALPTRAWPLLAVPDRDDVRRRGHIRKLGTDYLVLLRRDRRRRPQKPEDLDQPQSVDEPAGRNDS
jgi:restriction system protein